MKKEKYISPEMEIIEFECDDVIISSGPIIGGNGNQTPVVGYGMTYDPTTGLWTDNTESGG
ncbi:MAG: hypothetical protein IK999_14765 [Ruminococcus sp.]|nr:hypothetical protein [Ruminococcus sp.]